ncbi:MAG: protein-glutamate O-methyltransferase CheR [Pseudomonadota bacterium]
MNISSGTQKGAGNFPMTQKDFETIASILYKASGIRLTEKKAQLVHSRLSKRLRARGLSQFHDYCLLLQKDQEKDELGLAVQALTTNVTRFFREPHHFETLRSQVLPSLTQKARRGDPIRFWSAGCSAGQEPYSLAIEILEWMPDADQLDIKILATDIDKTMIDTGRRGRYSASEVENIADARRAKHLARLPQKDEWKVSDPLRKLVSFNTLNLFGAWPMQRPFDVVFCRNVVIYFDAADQIILWDKFASHMSPGSWLMIGHSERVTGKAVNQFEANGVTTYRLKQR